MLDAVALAGHAGMAPNKLLMGIPLYARSTGGTTTSACLSANDLGQGTFPFYAVNSLFSDDGLYEGDMCVDSLITPASFSEPRPQQTRVCQLRRLLRNLRCAID